MTLGDKIKDIEKMMKFLINEKLYKDYLKGLESKSDGTTSYFPNPDDWDAYRKERMRQILK